MANKSYGWVIEMKPIASHFEEGVRRFYTCDAEYVGPLVMAHSYPTRNEARLMKDDDEVLRKVSLDTDGQPTKIIAGR